MTRHLKFRAWIKKHKVMEGPEGWLLIGQNGQLFVSGPMTSPKPISSDEVELMQFTGLLDKNGKEIYEGDVVEVDWEMGTDKNGEAITWFGGVVKYDEDESKFYIDYDGFEDWFYCKKNFVVHGNIYENPELLTPKPL